MANQPVGNNVDEAGDQDSITPLSYCVHMGTQNRQRRAAKKKRDAYRNGRESGRASSSTSSRTSSADASASHVHFLLYDTIRAPQWVIDAAVDELARIDPAVVHRVAEAELVRSLRVLWDNGWLPAEAIRRGRRFDGRVGRLVAVAVAVDHFAWSATPLDPRWRAHVAALELAEMHSLRGWLAPFGDDEGLDRFGLVKIIVETLHLLRTSSRLHTIIPPPGTTPQSGKQSILDTSPPTDDPVLAKVRALLAQAESTTFDAEAEVFTAKAQELMARHAIDLAMLWASSGRDERPFTTRIPIDDPYADIKSLLLQFVAEHSRCRAIFEAHNSLSTVVGFASDVANTEVLFTSLLVQSQAALAAESANAGPGARSRSRGFRSSFLMAYTCRIDERLEQINAAVQASAVADDRSRSASDGESVSDLLPVLAARGAAVDERVTELFGTVRTSRVSGGSDGFGWARGQSAADLAKLNAADLAERTRRSPSAGPPPLSR